MIGRSRLNPVLDSMFLAAALSIAWVTIDPAVSQETLPEGISLPNYEPGITEQLMERTDMGNVAQSALMQYNAGVRDLAKAQKQQDKVNAATDPKDRAKAVAKAKSSLESAEQAFREALSFDNSMIEAYAGLGTTLRLQGKIEDALEVHAMALRLAPDDLENFEGWTESLLALNMLGNATTAYTGYIQTNPARAEILMTAIEQWLEDKRVDPGTVDPADVQRLADWVVEQKRG